eukprot:c2410_g1_i1.p1 GENE.c2410_g1_i1~~c2410_g1_i1.p1  ORF type:complete len:153 (-),score=43.06 c2410_g1_i1:16-474(-)
MGPAKFSSGRGLMGVLCTAIIGKNNKPLVMHCLRSCADLKFDYLVYAALDTIEDKIAVSKRQAQPSTPSEMYFGFLYPSEDKKLYGYVTNTNIKFVVVAEDADTREQDIRLFFKRLHALYVETAMNPFFVPDQPIKSVRFLSKLNAMVKAIS